MLLQNPFNKVRIFRRRRRARVPFAAADRTRLEFPSAGGWPHHLRPSGRGGARPHHPASVGFVFAANRRRRQRRRCARELPTASVLGGGTRQLAGHFGLRRGGAGHVLLRVVLDELRLAAQLQLQRKARHGRSELRQAQIFHRGFSALGTRFSGPVGGAQQAHRNIGARALHRKDFIRLL
jgi:hypothetical protein